MKIAVVGLGYVSAGFCVSGLFPISYLNDRVFVLRYDCLLVNQRMSSGLEQEQAPLPASLPQVGSESHKGPCILTPMRRVALGFVDILKELKSRRVSSNTS
jgi:hypothetical protein